MYVPTKRILEFVRNARAMATQKNHFISKLNLNHYFTGQQYDLQTNQLEKVIIRPRRQVCKKYILHAIILQYLSIASIA